MYLFPREMVSFQSARKISSLVGPKLYHLHRIGDCVLMLMLQIFLVALAELAEFDINFATVVNAFCICSHRNTLKQHAGKTLDEFCLSWNNKKQFSI